MSSCWAPGLEVAELPTSAAASLDLDPPECPHLLALSAIRTNIPLIPGSLPPDPSIRYHRQPGTSQPTPPSLPSSRTHFTGTLVHFHSALTFVSASSPPRPIQLCTGLLSRTTLGQT
ncbi:hypothetical protein CROQUDRAFT_111691 [Cronartium quercuum f. sp. fusiforme G11]|uniref:Uncharacterized protein n=1 Tax=Cronartium quercuum f. sp. fusiforme G11 TaxID=708437 RepID=A0A9P6N8F6_9BASI|nr:hypothetical protein CROQUDRAFT_111691 [Cronartium quercuum f. sp. fusiforme G11]